MRTIRLTVLGIASALVFSAAVQAGETDNGVTSGQLLERSRLYVAESGRGLGGDNGAIQRNRAQSMQGAQDGSQASTSVQTRTREQKQSRSREQLQQGGGSSSRYGQGYESRGGYGGNASSAGGSGRSGGQGGGKR